MALQASLKSQSKAQAQLSHRLRRAGRNAIFSLPWSAQSRSANQAPAQLPAPSLTISSTAFAALTLRQPKSESLSWFHSCSEPSHNEAIVCSSRLTLLYIPAVDRHTNHSGRLSLLLQFRAKQPSLIGTKQTTERQGQRVLLYLPLIYPKEVHNACEHWDLERTLPGKALIEGSQSPRSDNHGRNSPQHTPKNRELINHARISKTLWSKYRNVRDSTTQTVALVTHQGPGHRSPAPPAAHQLQLELRSHSLKPVDAVAIYALWRREGNWGYAPFRDLPREKW